MINTVQALWLMVALLLVLFAGGWTGGLRWALPDVRSAHRCLAGFNLLSGIGLALVALRGHLDFAVTHGGSNLFQVAAFVLLWRGGETLLNRGVAVTTKQQIAVFVLGAAAVLWFGRSPDDGRLRVMALFLTIAVICATNGWRGWRLQRGRGGRKGGWALLVIGWSVSLALIWRGGSGLAGGTPADLDYNAAENRELAYLLMLAAFLINIFFTYVLVARVVRRLDRLSSRDPLTGLLNRRALFEGLAAEWARFRRGDAVFTLLCLDIDHFKSINDGFGHPAGDAVLAGLSEVLNATLRQSDLSGRTGGEEFMIVLRDTAEAEALQTAERLRAAVAASTAMRPSPERVVTVSIGIASPDDRDETIDALVSRADAALYRAKTEGRNCVRVAAAVR